MLNQNNHKIDKLFQDKFQDFEPEVPEYVWNNISGALNAPNNRRKIMIWWSFAASVAILVSFTLGYYYNEAQNSKKYFSKNKEIFKKNTVSKKDDNSSQISENSIVYSKNTEANEYIKSISAQKKLPKKRNNTVKDSTYLSKVNKNQLPENHLIIKKLEYNQMLTSITCTKLEQNIILNLDTSYNDALKIQKNIAQIQAKKKQKKELEWFAGGRLTPLLSDNTSVNTTQEYAPVSSGSLVYASSTNNPDNSTLESEYKPTISGGLNIAVQAFKRIQIQTGLYYIAFRKASNSIAIVNSRENDVYFKDNTGLDFSNTSANELLANTPESLIKTNSTIVTNVEVFQDLQYIEIPFITRINLINKKFSFDILSGIGADILVKNNAYLIAGEIKKQIGKTENIKSNIYNAIGGIGLAYSITKRIIFIVEPTVRYSFNGINSNTSNKTTMVSFGAYTGINVKF